MVKMISDCLQCLATHRKPNNESKNSKSIRIAKKTETHVEDRTELEARKQWDRMSQTMCSCRKRTLLNGLRKDVEILKENEIHLHAQIIMYRMFQQVLVDELKQRNIRIVKEVDTNVENGPALGYKWKRESVGDVDEIIDLLTNLVMAHL